MLSMTGFGSHRIETENGTITIQVSSVNHRNCQVSVKNDFRDLMFDERVRKICRTELIRGSISVNIQWQPSTIHQLPLEQLKACYIQLRDLAQELSAPVPRLELLSPWLQRETQETAEDGFEIIEKCLQVALEALKKMRLEEGEQTANALNDMVATLTTIRQSMADCESTRVQSYRERLVERVSSVLADRVLDQNEIIKEVAVYADRIDVSEEIIRLGSHLEQLATLFAGESPEMGKRLEFLLQECGREVNTIGSKAHDAQLSQLVVDAKSALEQMREQAANII